MGLTGWHVLVLLGMFVVAAAVVVGIVLVIIFLARKMSAGPPAAAEPQLSPAAMRVARLAELDVLLQGGQVTESEYEAKRSEILGEI